MRGGNNLPPAPRRKHIKQLLTDPWTQINTVFAVIGYILAILFFGEEQIHIPIYLQVMASLFAAFLIGKTYKLLLAPAITMVVVALVNHYR
jgi:hypothetical protein